jgi:hypothetical protein
MVPPTRAWPAQTDVGNFEGGIQVRNIAMRIRMAMTMAIPTFTMVMKPR